MSYASDIKALNNYLLFNQEDNIISKIKNNSCKSLSNLERINLYKSSYEQRLISTTKTNYPALQYYIGDEKLDNLIKYFVLNTPSIYWDLNLYSIAFADFLTTQESDPKICQLARLESLIDEVFWTEDSIALDISFFNKLAEQNLHKVILEPRKAAKLIEFSYDVNSYLNDFRNNLAAQNINPLVNYLIIIRHNNEVKRHYISKNEYIILQRLYGRLSLGQAMESLEEELDQHELKLFLENFSSYFIKWIRFGLFAQ